MVEEVRKASAEKKAMGFGIVAQHPNSWSPPEVGWWKMNIDAGKVVKWAWGWEWST